MLVSDDMFQMVYLPNSAARPRCGVFLQNIMLKLGKMNNTPTVGKGLVLLIRVGSRNRIKRVNSIKTVVIIRIVMVLSCQPRVKVASCLIY